MPGLFDSLSFRFYLNREKTAEQSPISEPKARIVLHYFLISFIDNSTNIYCLLNHDLDDHTITIYTFQSVCFQTNGNGEASSLPSKFIRLIV